MNLEKSKGKFALLSDIALLIIAILQIYGVILEFITAESITRTEIIAIVIMLSITIFCGWLMIKGRS